MNQSASASGIQKSRQIRHLLSDYGIVIAFFVLCITLSLVSENFLTWGNWVNVLRQTSINGILAIGMTYVILTKGIDLSVGSVLALCGLITGSFVTGANPQNVYFAIFLGILAGGALGTVTGVLVSRLSVAPFVALATMRGDERTTQASRTPRSRGSVSR